MLVVAGFVTEVRVVDERTHVTIEEAGRVARFTLPGTNGRPLAVWGIPEIREGERWQIALVVGKLGLTPMGLGEGMTRLHPPEPPYNLNGLHYTADQLPRTFLLNEAGAEDLGIDATEALVVASLEEWSAVGCSTFRFAYGGRTSATADVEDGQNVIGWQETEWPWDPSVAGLTQTRFGLDAHGAIVPVESDILLNGDTWTWTGEPGDVAEHLLNGASVLVHELGHVTGMDHEYFYVTSTMFYAYVGGAWGGTLSGDDRRGLCENYPSGAGECATDDDCAADRTCREIDGLRVCDEVRSALGDACNLDDFNCTDYCVLNRVGTRGYCTVACDDADTCPDGFVCGEVPAVVLPDDDQAMCEPVAAVGDSGDAEPAADAAAEPGCGCAAGPAAAGWMALIAVLSSRRRCDP